MLPIAERAVRADGSASASAGVWHIIAGEYPPQSGGVSDYTERLVNGLAEAGHQVHVWTRGNHLLVDRPSENVFVHRCAGEFSPRSLRQLSLQLDAFDAPRRILVQYVPHAFGYKALNVAFAHWVRTRSRQYADDVRLMFHEVAYPWVRSPLRHNLIAAVNECMVRMMVPAASAVYVSTAAWSKRLIRLGASADKLFVLPIPSNIPETTDLAAIKSIRESLGADKDRQSIIGHFGTYGTNTRRLLLPIVEQWLAKPRNCQLHWIGGGSDEWAAELCRRFSDARAFISSTGRVSTAEVANHIAACDVMLQPYGDGATTRRTSLMACIVNRRAVVSTGGHHCEPFWSEHDLIRLGSLSDASGIVQLLETLIQSPSGRAEIAERAYKYYQQHLSLEHSLATLMEAPRDGR